MELNVNRKFLLTFDVAGYSEKKRVKEILRQGCSYSGNRGVASGGSGADRPRNQLGDTGACY